MYMHGRGRRYIQKKNKALVHDSTRDREDRVNDGHELIVMGVVQKADL